MAVENLILRMRAMGGRASAAEIAANKRALKEVRDEAGRASRAFGSVTTAMNRNMAALTMWGRRAGVVALAITGLGLKVGIEFNAMMEQQRVAFTSFLGSAPKARAYLRQLYDLAAKTPFEFQDVVQGTRRLMAFGMGADEALRTLRGLGDAIAAMGGSAEQIQRATMAIGQIRAAGVVHAQDLNQLIQAGVVSLPRLSKQMGMSTKEFRKRMSEGEIGADRFFKALRTNWETDPIYSGAAARQAKTFTGRLSTLRDYARQTLGSITFPLFDYLRKDGIPIATDFVNELNRIWNRELDLDVGTRIFMSRMAIRRHFQPLWEEAKGWYVRENVGDWLQGKFNDTLAAFAVSAGEAAPRVAEAFFHAFQSSNVWGKLFLAAWFLRVTGLLGVFRYAGGLAARRFATSFAATSMGTAVVGKYKALGGRLGPVFGRAFGLAAAGFIAVEVGKQIDVLSAKYLGTTNPAPGTEDRMRYGKTKGALEPFIRKNVPGANFLYSNVFDRGSGREPRPGLANRRDPFGVARLPGGLPRGPREFRRAAKRAGVRPGTAADFVVPVTLVMPNGDVLARTVARASRKKKSTR